MDEQMDKDLYPSEKEWKANFCENLFFLRKRAKLSQSELAEKFDLSGNTFSKYECGESIPPMKILIGLCNLYHVHLDELFATKLSESGGITTTQNLLTEQERERLNDALAKSIAYNERVDSFEYGNLRIHFKDKTGIRAPGRGGAVIEISFHELQEMFAEADRQRDAALAKQLRTTLDKRKYPCLLENTVPRARRMAELLEINFDEYAQKYELILQPLLRYLKMDSPFSEPPSKKLSIVSACEDILPAICTAFPRKNAESAICAGLSMQIMSKRAIDKSSRPRIVRGRELCFALSQTGTTRSSASGNFPRRCGRWCRLRLRGCRPRFRGGWRLWRAAGLGDARGLLGRSRSPAC